MRIPLLVAAGLLSLAACGGSGSGDDVARDPAPTASGSPAPVPVPTGAVRTTGLVTVIQPGSAPPEVCFGAVAESYPPQCSGPEVTGWSWGQDFEHQGQVRWGSYALTGRWDGTALAVTGSVPASLYDPAVVPPSAPPSPPAAYSTEQLDEIAAALQRQPGFVGAAALDTYVLADVQYDDGTVQDWADRTYGTGAVVIASALVPAR